MTAPYYTAIQSRKEDIVKTRITLTLLTALTLAGCSTPPPPPPALNNDAIVSSEVNGVTLQHRAAVSAPKQFKPIGEEYRSLYAASIMSSPNYTGTAVGSWTTPPRSTRWAKWKTAGWRSPLSAVAIWWGISGPTPAYRKRATNRRCAKICRAAHAPPNRTASKSAATARRVKRRFSYRILQ